MIDLRGLRLCFLAGADGLSWRCQRHLLERVTAKGNKLRSMRGDFINPSPYDTHFEVQEYVVLRPGAWGDSCE